VSAEGQPAAMSILTPHLVAYMDLLGFRSAVAAPTDEVQALILDALKQFKGAEQDFEIRVERTGEGQHTTHVKPGISAFSDHLVMSFNLADMQDSAVGIYQGLMSILSVANAMAHRAREFDCLLRGAVTIGPLYHREGIIFGQGLVAAYKLENETAKNPRIIIDSKVLEVVTAGENSDLLLFKDEDEYWCLDYMTAYLDYLDRQTGSDRSEPSCVLRRTWALGARGKALDMAAKLEAENAAALKEGAEQRAEKLQKAAGYWRWFAARFEKSMRAVNPYYFSATGAPIPFPE
jgi:hypothetical protein